MEKQLNVTREIHEGDSWGIRNTIRIEDNRSEGERPTGRLFLLGVLGGDVTHPSCHTQPAATLLLRGDESHRLTIPP